MKSRIFPLIMLLCLAVTGHAAGITLKKDRFRIVNLAGDSKPIQRAIGSLQTDIEKVMEFRPAVVTGSSDGAETGGCSLVIINDAVAATQGVSPLNGEEAHEVRADKKNNRIIIHGSDTRGTIFAIYTFTEQVLGVPPLWYYCQWQPATRTSLTTAINLRFASPQVRFRAWFPNDTDLFTPWRKLSRANNEMWLETLLRLKLNTVELETTVTYPDYKMSDEAQMVSDMGIVLTSHHHVALNNSFTKWDEYWRQVRHREPPKPSVHNLKDLTDFWTYNVETVHRSGIENLWQVTFRGRGDQPFWAFFDDAPKSDAERGAVITQMMQIQVDLIKKITGEKDPYVRTTFYDEMSNFLAKGYIRPPKGEHMIWTYVAARRDHYPNDDVVAFDPSSGVKLGYYMNLQFTSTGAHLAPAEGPWKMEFNYRYVNSKAPLLFAVVNAGNIREFVTEMSAYAKMMWSYADYDTDRWLDGFCAQYFGKRHAAEAAQLFRDYYDAFWQPKPTDFPGMTGRQYVFQDMRYARAIDQILGRFRRYSDNPLQDIGFESVRGRSFRIQGNNQVDTLIKNMAVTKERFASVASRSAKLSERIDSRQRAFYDYTITVPAEYMTHLSHSLYHFLLAYKGQHDTDTLRTHMTEALSHMEAAKAALHSTHYGVFSAWYDNDRLFGLDHKINGMKKILEEIKPAAPAVQGTWDKALYPNAEPIKHELLGEFKWQPGPSNRPIGVARGIYPGRVVMTRYPEVCRWAGRWNVEADQWFLPENTDLGKCCEMMSETLQALTGTKSDRKAWRKIFEYYHRRRFGTAWRGYRKGEKVAVKVNVNNAKARERQSNMSDEAPQVIMAMVRQLVEKAGVPAADIIIYDARRPFAPEILNLVWSEYPDVTFLQDDPGIRDYQPVNPKTGDYSKLQKPVWKRALTFSHGKFDGACLIPEQVRDAKYIVNLAMLKLHSYPHNYMEGGDDGQTAVTMTAKNHAGSVRAPWEMHHWLNTRQDGKPNAYSPLVDLNASPALGAKTILYMLDGLYCGRKHASFPLHFPNAPFFNRTEPYENPEWPASLLASLDEVALESVGLDLLYAQSIGNTEPGFYDVPRIMVRNQADDYLREMADPQNAPSGIKYVQDGKPVESLGVFEHWDSPQTMRYSRNLDSRNGKGIEFIYIPMGTARKIER